MSDRTDRGACLCGPFHWTAAAHSGSGRTPYPGFPAARAGLPRRTNRHPDTAWTGGSIERNVCADCGGRACWVPGAVSD
jgi:hypothetical protein